MAKLYVYGVIACGALLLCGSLANWSAPDPRATAIYVALAMLASIIKLRLPGMDGTYSLGFLFLLYGVAHFSLAETLVAACGGAIAGSLFNTDKRPMPIQVLFNTANLAASVSVCFVLVRVWFAAGAAHYLPALLAMAACVHFVINTVLVSGVLSLLQGKPLVEIYSEWYVWCFPYYLIGVALVGLFPAPGSAIPGEAWLILVPLVYLVHFFLGLLHWHAASAPIGEQPNAPLPPPAKAFVTATVVTGALLLVAAAFQWNSQSPVRFVAYLSLAVVASTLKVHLPRMRGTLSPSFVLVLAAIAQMSFGEVALMAALVGLVQVLWRSARRPMLAQVLFSMANLTVSAALAYWLCRIALGPWLGQSPAGQLVVSTLAFYGCNSLMLATVLALVDGKPLAAVWQLCCFWSLPYYLVGAAVAGVMTAAWRMADWPASLLILPLMGLVFISYRVHVRQALLRTGQTAQALA